MATLKDTRIGQWIMLAFRVSASDPDAGITLALCGAHANPVGTLTFAPDMSASGSTTVAPGDITIVAIPGDTPVSVGDILCNDRTGETVICRWEQMDRDGRVAWSSSLNHRAVYSPEGWTIIGHVDLSASA